MSSSRSFDSSREFVRMSARAGRSPKTPLRPDSRPDKTSDLDRGVIDFRERGYRQLFVSYQSGEHQPDHQEAGRDGPQYERPRRAHFCGTPLLRLPDGSCFGALSLLSVVPGLPEGVAWPPAGPPVGLRASILLPSVNLSRPSVTTSSPGWIPLSIAITFPSVIPVLTVRTLATFPFTT